MNRIRQKNLEDISKFTVIPDGWKEVTIQEVCNIGRGRVISQEEIKSNLGIYPVYSSQTRNNGRMGSIDTYDFDGEFITWTTDGENAGTVFHRLGKFNCTNVCGTLTAKDDEVDHSFLSYHLGRIAKSYVSYIGNPKLMNGVMGDIGLILPPLDEQQKIAKILSTVDNLIEETQTLIDKYTAIKQGMMADLFTRGIDMTTGDSPNPKGGKLRPSVEDAPELYKETELGWVPKEWEVVEFGEVVEVIDPNPSHRYPEASNEGIPLCSTESFSGEDNFVIKKPKLVPLETYEQQNLRCRFKETDVIFARKGRIGLARRYGNQKKAFSHTVVVMKPANKSIDEKWLLWISRSYGFLHFIDNTMNTNLGVPTLGVDFIKKVPIVCPSEREQSVIAERLDKVTLLVNTQMEELSKYKMKKKGLMQDLLTGKVRVV